MKRYSPFFLVLALSIISCERSKPVLELADNHWPEGTVVSLIGNGKVISRSPLIGGRIRFQAPKEGLYKIRVAAPRSITAVIPGFEIVRGVNGFTLPNPISQRRVGAVKLGMEYAVENPAALYTALSDSFSADVSSVSFEPGKGVDADNLIYGAHSKAIEVSIRGDFRNLKSLRRAGKLVSALVDSAEICGAEGIIFLPPAKDNYSGQTVALTRKLASQVHERGMSFSVGLDAGKLEKFNPVVFLDKVPAQERPDELRILCGLHESPKDGLSPVSIEEIGAVLVRMSEARIPLSVISLEVLLSAFAWRSGGGKKIEPVKLEPGELETILKEAGEGGVLRLGDGSLELAYKGNRYAFDNLSGIASKISFLSSGELSRIRGFSIRYDGLGLKPDGEGLKKLAGVFTK